MGCGSLGTNTHGLSCLCQGEAWSLHHSQPRSRSATVGTSNFIPTRWLQEEI